MPTLFKATLTAILLRRKLDLTVMNLLSITCRILGINRPEPKTRLGRNLRRANRALSGLACLYLGLLLFPQVLFAKQLSVDGVTLYSRDPLPAETSACVHKAMELVGKSELAVPGRKERIFICNSEGLYRLFTPSGGSFAISMPFTDNIFVASADFANDIARPHAASPVSRSLSGTLAHEITHGLIRHRIGNWKSIRLPEWIAEGYCDFVAGSGSFPEAEGLRIMIAGDSEPSASFRYFRYRQMLRYLTEGRSLSFDEVVARAKGEGLVAAETRAWLRASQAP
ncbi:hypothetical protein [Haloferula sp. BvORR071]|uniref:hypothetical protein n=1 Tax=Haloferula sp. BvORR071 TaxID=1396141 RepID=UPI000554CD13|nr:hypothetical protein [Haloferula sp. BvORR071]